LKILIAVGVGWLVLLVPLCIWAWRTRKTSQPQGESKSAGPSSRAGGRDAAHLA
jgi:hypothetical protein